MSILSTVRSWFAKRAQRPREKQQDQQAYESVLRSLPRQEREVLEFRYGLLDGELHTLEEVSRAFGVMRERIRQIEKQTLKKLHWLEQEDNDPDEPEPEGGLGVREPRRPRPPGWSGAVALPIADSADDG